MNKTHEFNAIIKKVPDIDGAYVEYRLISKKYLGKGVFRYMLHLMGSRMTVSLLKWEHLVILLVFVKIFERKLANSRVIIFM